MPPIYNSTASHTFKKLPCGHPFCHNNGHIFTCKNGECIYREEYLGGSVTEGVAVSDVMETPPNNHILLHFGCSRNSRNFGAFERLGRSGGIIGLNLSPASLLQQLGNITQHRFSYCLVAIPGDVSIFLRFGSDISTHGRSFKSIPIITSPSAPGDFYLDLRDISIEGNRMGFPPGTFTVKQGGSGGCIIDSGTGLTHVIQPAYQRLARAFQDYFHRHGIQPIHLPPQVHYNLCFRKTQAAARFPSMTFHFHGADMEVEAENLFVTLGDYKAFCLALQSSPHFTIIGAKQQINTPFIYDAAARQILFARENCIEDAR